MRTSLFLFISSLVFGAVEAELRHAYQNIELFLQYRAEFYKPRDERIIGVKCTAAHPTTLSCLEPTDGRDRYSRCEDGLPANQGRPHPERSPCNLGEFLSHTSGNRRNPNTGILDGPNVYDFSQRNIIRDHGHNQNSITFDIDDAASRMNHMGWGHEQSPHYTMVKDSTGYINAISRCARRIGGIKVGMTEGEINNAENAFRRLDYTVDRVVLTRTIDRDSHTITTLNNDLARNNARVSITEHLEIGRGQKTFDYEATIEKFNKRADRQTITRILDTGLQRIQGTDVARQHEAPLAAWGRSKGEMVPVPGCVRRP